MVLTENSTSLHVSHSISILCMFIRRDDVTYVETVFFLSGFSFTDWRFMEHQGKGGDHFYSSLPLAIVHEHSGMIYKNMS